MYSIPQLSNRALRQFLIVTRYQEDKGTLLSENLEEGSFLCIESKGNYRF